MIIKIKFSKYHYYKKSRLTVFFNYPCDALPIITPDNRGSTIVEL